MSEMEQLTFLSEEALAKVSPSQGVERVLKENRDSCSSTFELFATSCEPRGGVLRDTSSGRTSRDAFRATRGKTSDAYSTSWKSAGISWRGERWTRNLPEYLTGRVVDSGGRYRNAAGASTLSEVLEARAPQTYSLSARACEGIIRRAEKRGKPLPKMLQDALEWVIARDSSTTREAQRGGVGYEPGTSPTLTADYHQPAIMSLQSDGSSSNGNQNGCGYSGDGSAYTLNGRDKQAVAFAQNTRDEVRLFGGDGQTVGALAAQPGMKQTSYVCMQDGQSNGTIAEDGTSTTLNASHEQPIVCAADDNGKTAVEEDMCGSLKVGGGSP